MDSDRAVKSSYTEKLDGCFPQLSFAERTDSGPGIPADALGRIFEPFFTTKPLGQGTGLGLPLCQGIIERHGGSIRVASRPNHWAVFSVELPIDSRRPTTLEITAPASLPPIRERTVLVVDDDRDVGETLRELRHHPELLRRLAFLTGDTLSPETREFLEHTRVPTMAKPFTLE